MSVDRTWYLDINHFSRETTWLHGFLAAYALWAGLTALAVTLVSGWWLLARRGPDAPRRVAAAFLAGVGSLIALGANQMIGSAVDRIRPCHTLHHTVVLLSCANDPSFPSDHAMIAGALTVGLFFLDRRLGLVGVVLALLLAFARVYAGVHYPGDVAGGLAIGATIGFLVVVLFRPFVAAIGTRVAGTPLRPLIVAGSGQPGGSA